jgi:uncharacterized protein involved in exopolysaccharide biosynthesis
MTSESLPPNATEAGDNFTARGLVRHLGKQKFFLLALGVVGLVAAAGFVSIRKLHYKSVASIFVLSESSGLPAILGDSPLPLSSFKEATSKDYVYALVDSDWMRREILTRAEKARPGFFWAQSGLKAEHRTPEKALKLLKNWVEMKTGPKDPIFITARTSNSELSLLLAETCLEILSERLEADLRREEEFISGQLAKLNAHLSQAESALANYQGKVGLSAPPEHQAKEVFSNYARLSEELVEAQAGYLSLSERLDAPGDMSQSLQLLSEKAGVAARMTYIEDLMNQQRKDLKKFPSTSLEINRLERNLRIDEQRLLALTRNYEEARMKRERDLLPFRIIDRPYLNVTPDDLPTSLVLICGVLLGCLAGMGWIVIGLI